MLAGKYMFPAVLNLCRDKNIKLYLGPCKVVATQAGKWCLVSPVFGAGYYGTFHGGGLFLPTRACTQEHIDLLMQVETDGLAAVAKIGLATGCCCICCLSRG